MSTPISNLSMSFTKSPCPLGVAPLNTIIIYVWAMNRGTKLLGLRYTCRKENRLQCSESITARQTRFRTLIWIIDPWPNFRTRPKTIPDPNCATQTRTGKFQWARSDRQETCLTMSFWGRLFCGALMCDVLLDSNVIFDSCAWIPWTSHVHSDLVGRRIRGLNKTLQELNLSTEVRLG